MKNSKYQDLCITENL